MAESDELQLSRGVPQSLDALGNGLEDEATEADEGDAPGVGSSRVDDPELEATKTRVKMEEEAEELKQPQAEVDKQINLWSSPGTSSLNRSIERKREADSRSIYVGNVDYGTTTDELEQHFHGCGFTNRITMIFESKDGNSKEYAFMEFTERESVQVAMTLDQSLFRGRRIKVMPKRTNIPGFIKTNRPPRARGYRGGRARSSSYYGYRPTWRPRGYRGRSSYYMPY